MRPTAFARPIEPQEWRGVTLLNEGKAVVIFGERPYPGARVADEVREPA
jgi:hypothetical protein